MYEISNIKAIGIKDDTVKTLIDLSHNKKIEDGSLFMVEGLWAYEKLIQSEVKIEAFLFCHDFIKSAAVMELTRALIKLADRAYQISSKLCERISSQDKSEGFFMLCRARSYTLGDIELKKNNLIVILDGIEQSGNAGTIIRSVDGAGGDAVVLCNSKIRQNNQKLIKASMGASFILPAIHTEMHELLVWLKRNNFKIVLTDLTAQKSYFEIDYSGRIAIVAGNEIHGISEEWRQHECEKVIIPMLGGADSLNVGIATALVTYEASMRQKGIIKRNS